ncbi:MarR family transcriptional regulator [Algimonas arctica]|uniref:MarR family transcriptional regulator n=1 Tax=Algimonas arctica TaxID=1479486 RepID=A0A8J3CSX1_9PROT|nr:MarR family transcriptional regulator [Algimonas arctica]GHA97855.1 MarR family transcriptional regulator [Algimonas arctica]
MTYHNDVLTSLRKITRAIDLHSKSLMKDIGLTTPQLLVLQQVGQSGRARPSEVAKQVHLSQATITSIVDRLVKAELVTRARSEADRRSVDIILTQAGRTKLDAAPALLQKEFLATFDNLENWEKTLLVSSLQRLAAMMDAESIDAAPILELGDISPPPD